ncbi:MAG: hypothetical protein J6X07_06785 [Prevotella sp.]|nr:hypothetical protein [Prevotella sp.]
MPTPKNKYDREHLSRIEAIKRQIDAIYAEAVKEAAALGVTIDMPQDAEKPFSFDDYPMTEKRIEELMAWLRGQLETAVVNGIKAEWALSNDKNDAMVARVFGSGFGDLPENVRSRYLSTNDAAREAFIQRKRNGLGLSDYVWKYADGFKNEIEMGLDLGIREGKDAPAMARDLKQYLRHPDMLFRRVRDEHGMLHLSKRAAAFHPGRGVYRSSYLNARRLAATETNIAYRTADHERWKQMDFVVGIEIHLSNNHTCKGRDGKPHPFDDICDELQGKYPKDFKFTGWHPHCRCFATSILKTDEEIAEDTKKMLRGEEVTGESVNTVEDVPEGFKKWTEKNEERMAAAASLPHFISDNVGHVSEVMADSRNVVGLLEQLRGVKAKHINNSFKGLVMADFTGGVAAITVKGVRDLINLYYEKEAHRERVQILERIIKDRGFRRMKYHSTKDNSVFAMGMSAFDRKLKEGEMPGNLMMAKKMLAQGYDVFILPNIKETSADFILRRSGKLYYAEGKSSYGQNSLDNRLLNGTEQSSRIIADIQGNKNANYIASTLKMVFGKRPNLQEVILLKGSRMIKVGRKAFKSKRFEEMIRKEWVKNK